MDYTFRGVAQLVERVVWDHEVAGSIPVTSTIQDAKSVENSEFQHFLFLFKII